MNGRYMRALPVQELTDRLERFTGRSGLRAAVEISQEKMQTLADFEPLAGFIFDGPADDPKARAKWLDEDGRAALADVRAALEPLPEFTLENVLEALEGVVAARGAKPKQVFQPIRVALAGTAISPGIFETLAVLGRDEALARIEKALLG
jgi:glutamyl-tRNA synthetase